MIEQKGDEESMAQNLNFIIEQVGKDKGIARQVIIDALENAVLMASRKKYGPQREMEAHYNEEIGEVERKRWRIPIPRFCWRRRGSWIRIRRWGTVWE
jgi:N utilization substance protein A